MSCWTAAGCDGCLFSFFRYASRCCEFHSRSFMIISMRAMVLSFGQELPCHRSCKARSVMPALVSDLSERQPFPKRPVPCRPAHHRRVSGIPGGASG